MARFTKIYVEGGGDKNKAAQTGLRRAFSEFLKKSGVSRLPAVVACGARDEAFKDFCIAHQAGDGHPMLLVDSEAPVTTNSRWTHLKDRDKWDRPAGSTEEQCHLMVQQMESWFLADKERLAEYFGAGFNVKKLPQAANVEGIDRHDVIKAIELQAGHSKRGGYRKGADQATILGMLRPEFVRQASFHCDLFLNACAQD